MTILLLLHYFAINVIFCQEIQHHCILHGMFVNKVMQHKQYIIEFNKEFNNYYYKMTMKQHDNNLLIEIKKLSLTSFLSEKVLIAEITNSATLLRKKKNKQKLIKIWSSINELNHCYYSYSYDCSKTVICDIQSTKVPTGSDSRKNDHSLY